MARLRDAGAVSPYATKADAKVAAADARAREAKAAQNEADSRADAADRRAERLEAVLERIGERLDAIERRLERKGPAAPKVDVRAEMQAQVIETRIDQSGGALLYGLKAISTSMGVRPRQAQHLVETDQIPHFHMGRVICAHRPLLTAWLDARATGTTPPAP